MLIIILCSSSGRLKGKKQGGGIVFHCAAGQEHICCVQVVWEEQLKTEVQLKSILSVLAALSELASTAAELDQSDSSSIILSFPCLKRTPTSASQLLHPVKQLCCCWAQSGFQLQSTIIPYSPQCSLSKTQSCRGPIFIQGVVMVTPVVRPVTRCPAPILFTVKRVMQHSL